MGGPNDTVTLAQAAGGGGGGEEGLGAMSDPSRVLGTAPGAKYILRQSTNSDYM